MKLEINPDNRKYYSDDFIKGFECGVDRQYEEDNKKKGRIMEKFNRQLLKDEIDMLNGNINRMCVTKTFKELSEMQDYAIKRVMKIYSMNWDRLRESGEE